MEEKIKIKKREIYLTLFVLLSLYFSLAETIIPKPFPWIKLGIANIATLLALEKFGEKMAIEVTILRIFIQGVMLGTLLSPGFIISFFSGIVSISGMIFLYRFRESLSLISISLVSGFLHNLTQLIVVYILMFRNVDITNRAILAFILIFLGIGALSGIITGYIAEKIQIRKVNIYNEKIFWN